MSELQQICQRLLAYCEADVAVRRLCKANHWDIPDDVMGKYNQLAFLKRVFGRIAWEQLKGGSVSFVTAHIDWWLEANPGGDPLRDPKLMREIREVYQASPPSPARMEYLAEVAAALRIPRRQAAAILGDAHG